SLWRAIRRTSPSPQSPHCLADLARVEQCTADILALPRLRRAAMPAALAVVLAAGLDAANKTLTREHDAVGNDLALRNGGPQPPGRADEHSPGGRLAQPAT